MLKIQPLLCIPGRLYSCGLLDCGACFIFMSDLCVGLNGQVHLSPICVLHFSLAFPMFHGPIELQIVHPSAPSLGPPEPLQFWQSSLPVFFVLMFFNGMGFGHVSIDMLYLHSNIFYLSSHVLSQCAMVPLYLSNFQDNILCKLSFILLAYKINKTNLTKKGSIPFAQTSLSREFTYLPYKS